MAPRRSRRRRTRVGERALELLRTCPLVWVAAVVAAGTLAGEVRARAGRLQPQVGQADREAPVRVLRDHARSIAEEAAKVLGIQLEK